MSVMNFYVYIVTKYIKQNFIESQEKWTKKKIKDFKSVLETTKQKDKNECNNRIKHLQASVCVYV